MDDPKVWLEALAPKLTSRWGELRKYEDYYFGRQPLAFATANYREQFATMLRSLCDNWMVLLVSAVSERLHVDGFRFSQGAAADQDAWRIWQRNELDADSEIAHSTALATSVCPIMVWADRDGLAEITIEHPSQVYVAYESGSRRRRLAALKMWVDDWTGATFANVYLPDTITKFSGKTTGKGGTPTTWELRDATEESIPNPLGVVPIVELVNRPQLIGGGQSEIAEFLSTQDQINKLVCDMIVAAEFGAFRQRWATGIDIPDDGDDDESAKFRAEIDRFWHTSNEAARFGEFAQTDLGIYVKAIESRLQSLASRSRVPAHYLLGQSGQFPSGESLKATETGLIAKAHSRMRQFGERYEEIMRLAFAVEGSDRSDIVDAEVIWQDPESRTESEHVDSLVKKLSIGVPMQQLWEDAGYTPTQVARFKQWAAETAAMQALATITTQVPQESPPAPAAPAGG